MEVRCSLCGKKNEINKMHKDYEKIARQKSTYVCEICENKLRYNAWERNNPPKPI